MNDLTLDPPSYQKSRPGTAIVLGAGPTGLSTAWRLAKHGWRVTVIEKGSELGGHSKTSKLHGYDVDDGPHKLYPQVPIAKLMIDHFVGPDLLTTSKKSLIYLNGKYIPFPFGIVDLFKGLGVRVGLRCGISYALGKVERILKGRGKTYTDYVIGLYGRYPHELVFRQVAKKIWGDPDWLDIQLAETRIIAPNLLELVKSLFQGGIKNKPKLSADQFYYPRHGLRQLWEAMWSETAAAGGTIYRGTAPEKIMAHDRGYNVRLTVGGRPLELSSDALVSTIPLKSFIGTLDPPPPTAVREAVASLQATSLMILYVVVDTPRLLPANWIFYPESKLHFGRVSEQKGFSESMVPADRTVLMVEIQMAREEIQRMNRDQLIRESIEQLRQVGILKPEHHVLEHFTTYDDAVYPKYDLAWKEKFGAILGYSDSLPGCYLNGRHGLFCYNNMDHSMEMGVLLADHIASGAAVESWQKTRQAFYQYRIVD